MPPSQAKPPKLPATVVALGVVSLLTDTSSEMIYPLLPVFLATVLHAGALSLGVIEGVAETTSSLLKVASGLWADRARSRKPMVLAGYSLSSIMRPLIGLASAWPWVLAFRFADRIGKGLRTSPRDAMIAEVTDESLRGRAFGFHRAMDHAGAVLGPLIAAALLTLLHVPLRTVFLLSSIPAALVILVLIAGVREPKLIREPKPTTLLGGWKELSGDYKRLLLALLVFTLGNSTDAFLLLKLSQAGLSASSVALLWSAHHVVKMASSYFGGRLSDRLGRKALMLSGWLLYAAVYLAFALIESPAGLIAIFLVYGLYYGMCEPSEKAWVADLVPARLRGSAFGYYHGTVGLMALPASLLFGLLWYQAGAHVAFGTGALLALVASALLIRTKNTSPASAP